MQLRPDSHCASGQEDNTDPHFWPTSISHYNHMGKGTCLNSWGLEASICFQLKWDISFPQDALLTKKTFANVMLYNAMIFITAQHASSACDLALDQLSLKPSKWAARDGGENSHGIWLGFQAILAAASEHLSPHSHLAQRETRLQHPIPASGTLTSPQHITWGAMELGGTSLENLGASN